MWTGDVSWPNNRYKSGQLRLVGYLIDDVVKVVTILRVNKVIDYDVRDLVNTEIIRHVKSPIVATWRYVVTYDGSIMVQITFDDNNEANVLFSHHTQTNDVDTLTLDQIKF